MLVSASAGKYPNTKANYNGELLKCSFIIFQSSLLMAAMNELHVKKGEIKVNGSTAFTAQQPWIFSGTVRQNILFGREYKKDWYQTVIKACGMHTVRFYLHDIITFPKGLYSNRILGRPFRVC